MSVNSHSGRIWRIWIQRSQRNFDDNDSPSAPILEVLWVLLIVALIESLEKLAVLWQEQVSNFHWALFLRDTVGKHLARACQCFSFSRMAFAFVFGCVNRHGK